MGASGKWVSGALFALVFGGCDAGAPRFPLVVPANDPALRHGTSVLEGATLVATGEPGTVVFGPYMDMPRGRFLVRWIGQGIDSPGTIAFDATATGEPKNFAQYDVPAKNLPRYDGATVGALEIELPKGAHGFEIRVYSSGGGLIRLTRAVIERR